MGEELVVVNNVKCAARNCKNNVLDCQDVSFFQFPEDSVRAKIWVDNCNRIDLLDKDAVSLQANYYVCSVHFEHSMFTCSLKNTLTHEAVPTIFMLDNDAASFSQKGDPPEKVVKHEDSIVKEEIIDEECQKDVNTVTGSVVAEVEVNREHDEELAMYDGLVHPAAISPKIEIEVENTEIKEEIISEGHQEYLNEVGTVNMKTGSVEIEKVYVEEELEMECETDTAGDIDPLGDDDQVKCEGGAGVEDNQSANNGMLGVSKAEDSGKIVKLILVPSHLKAKYQDKSRNNQDAKSEEIRKTSGESSAVNTGVSSQHQVTKSGFSSLGGKVNNDYVCHICNFKTPYGTTLDRHIIRHVDDDQYKCLLCSYKADLIGELKEHMSVHATLKVFKCDMCTYSVDLEASLSRHKGLVHKRIPRHILQNDKKNIVRTNRGSFPCQYCDYSASHISFLGRHMKKHGERAYPCPHCKYRARKSSFLEKHLQTHLNYNCDQCDYRASKRAYVVKHKEQVHGDQ